VYPLVAHLHFEILGPAAVAAKPAPYLGGALHHDDSIGPRPRRRLTVGRGGGLRVDTLETIKQQTKQAASRAAVKSA
jgi:hypothetical protein